MIMKKIYTQPEWKVVSYTEDPITTSGNGDGNHGFSMGPSNMFDDNTPADEWVW